MVDISKIEEAERLKKEIIAFNFFHSSKRIGCLSMSEDYYKRRKDMDSALQLLLNSAEYKEEVAAKKQQNKQRAVIQGKFLLKTNKNVRKAFFAQKSRDTRTGSIHDRNWRNNLVRNRQKYKDQSSDLSNLVSNFLGKPSSSDGVCE